jgi:hypothetical protein
VVHNSLCTHGFSAVAAVQTATAIAEEQQQEQLQWPYNSIKQQSTGDLGPCSESSQGTLSQQSSQNSVVKPSRSRVPVQHHALAQMQSSQPQQEQHRDTLQSVDLQGHQTAKQQGEEEACFVQDPESSGFEFLMQPVRRLRSATGGESSLSMAPEAPLMHEQGSSSSHASYRDAEQAPPCAVRAASEDQQASCRKMRDTIELDVPDAAEDELELGLYELSPFEAGSTADEEGMLLEGWVAEGAARASEEGLVMRLKGGCWLPGEDTGLLHEEDWEWDSWEDTKGRGGQDGWEWPEQQLEQQQVEVQGAGFPSCPLLTEWHQPEHQQHGLIRGVPSMSQHQLRGQPAGWDQRHQWGPEGHGEREKHSGAHDCAVSKSHNSCSAGRGSCSGSRPINLTSSHQSADEELTLSDFNHSEAVVMHWTNNSDCPCTSSRGPGATALLKQQLSRQQIGSEDSHWGLGIILRLRGGAALSSSSSSEDEDEECSSGPKPAAGTSEGRGRQKAKHSLKDYLAKAKAKGFLGSVAKLGGSSSSSGKSSSCSTSTSSSDTEATYASQPQRVAQHAPGAASSSNMQVSGRSPTQQQQPQGQVQVQKQQVQPPPNHQHAQVSQAAIMGPSVGSSNSSMYYVCIQTGSGPGAGINEQVCHLVVHLSSTSLNVSQH